ncbi:MAG: HTH-type transcriptional repressor NsrR [Phycisphaerae bacterium]|nr:HTH-type transcriptional repressor NsrR [Phycisphaerae bacterium]
MLSLSRKTDYALVAMVALAKKYPGLMSARQIAEEHKLPLAMLMNILKELLAGGLVNSLRGINGGYRLTRAAEQITLGQIVEASEGPIRLVNCCEEHSAAVEGAEADMCDRRQSCPAAEPLRKVNNYLQIFLGQITLADLLADQVPMLVRVANIQPNESDPLVAAAG